MSYQGFKRVLGETSLERKCRWWFGISLGVMLFLSFLWYSYKIDERVLERDRSLGRELVRATWLERHFWLEERLKYGGRPNAGDDLSEAGADATEEANAQEYEERQFYEKVVEAGRSLGRDFEAYTILPPYADAGQFYPPEYEWEAELINQFPNRTTQIESDEESERGESTASEEPNRFREMLIERNGKQRYLYYQPVYASSSTCVTCHRAGIARGKFEHLTEGDLMAVVRIDIDREETRKALARDKAYLWMTAVIIGFLSMFLLYFTVRYVIVKPVTHLRDVANAVREGDVEQRADIKTADEFEELAASFNRMLRRLLRQQDALQEVNEELDAKIDQLAQANMRLFEMNRQKSDFLATMSHELRTPLNSILGFSEVLAAIDSLDEREKRYVANIQRSGRMLLEQINDILDLAKMESGKMEVRPAEFRIDAVVNAQCDMARPLTERKNIDLEVECQKGMPPMRQDQGKVQQVLNNLLSNAIKFTPEGGRIVVRAQRDPSDMLRLTVEDTGVGISEADQAVVFEKFRQASSAQPRGDAMTREHSGTGLGLSIVRELCRLLGGDVTLSSVLGKGSTFTVQLPWTVSVNRNMQAQLEQDVAELTRAPMLTLDS